MNHQIPVNKSSHCCRTVAPTEHLQILDSQLVRSFHVYFSLSERSRRLNTAECINYKILHYDQNGVIPVVWEGHGRNPSAHSRTLICCSPPLADTAMWKMVRTVDGRPPELWISEVAAPFRSILTSLGAETEEKVFSPQNLLISQSHIHTPLVFSCRRVVGVRASDWTLKIKQCSIKAVCSCGEKLAVWKNQWRLEFKSYLETALICTQYEKSYFPPKFTSAFIHFFRTRLLYKWHNIFNSDR